MSSSISPPRLLHVLLATVLSFAALTAGSLPAGPGTPEGISGAGVHSLTAEARMTIGSAAPTLSVATTDPTVAPGSPVSFSATWAGSGPNCSLTPGWFRWSLGPNSSGVNLAASAGPNDTGVAWSASFEIAEVMVRSAAVLACGPTSVGELSVAYTNVSVVPPLSVDAVDLSTNPVRPGQALNLTASIAGGEPPYSARVSWGDGTQQVLEVSAPGSFSVPHAFPGGTFRPSVAVTDLRGDAANASVGQALAVGTGTVIGVSVSSPLAEPGVLLWLNGTVLGPRPSSVTSLTCGTGATTVRLPSVTETLCRPVVPGNLSVEFEVDNPFPPLALVDRFDEPVVAPLTVSISSFGSAEVGIPLLLRVAVAGGIPPLTVAWGFGPHDPPLPGAATGQLTLAADGAFLVAYPVDDPGAQWAEASADDAAGVVADSVLYLPPAIPALSLALDPTTVSASDASTCEVAATIRGGAAPYLWSISASQPLSSRDSLLGEAWSNASELDWDGRVLAEGAVSITLEVVDADGALRTANLTCSLAPPLAGEFSARWVAGANGPTALASFTLTGGTPPFWTTVSGPNGTVGAGLEDSDGNYTLALSGIGAAATGLTLSATDALGYGLNLTCSLLAPPSPPPPSTAPPLAPGGTSGSGDTAVVVAFAVFAGLVAAATLFVVRRRRRPRPTGFRPPDPEATIRSILSPADGADRLTIELMAEETGIPLEVVRSTIDRLIANGQIRSETTSDGEEALAWAGPPEP
jgi:hypothetical protein